MYYAFKESEVRLNEAFNNLLRSLSSRLTIREWILSLNISIVGQLKNFSYQLILSDSYIIGTA
jgi:hypothetical protein